MLYVSFVDISRTEIIKLKDIINMQSSSKLITLSTYCNFEVIVCCQCAIENAGRKLYIAEDFKIFPINRRIKYLPFKSQNIHYKNNHMLSEQYPIKFLGFKFKNLFLSKNINVSVLK